MAWRITLYNVRPRMGFIGPIQIENYEVTSKYSRYKGIYKCIRCGGSGAQVATVWRKLFPGGLSDEQVEVGMREKVERNHLCRGPFGRGSDA